MARNLISAVILLNIRMKTSTLRTHQTQPIFVVESEFNFNKIEKTHQLVFVPKSQALRTTDVPIKTKCLIFDITSRDVKSNLNGTFLSSSSFFLAS